MTMDGRREGGRGGRGEGDGEGGREGGREEGRGKFEQMAEWTNKLNSYLFFLRLK